MAFSIWIIEERGGDKEWDIAEADYFQDNVFYSKEDAEHEITDNILDEYLDGFRVREYKRVEKGK